MNPVRARLHELGVRPRKRLGQHFLISERYLERIVHTADLSPDDTVVEIGAGIGDLTESMASTARLVIALEVDPDLVVVLGKRFGGRPNVAVHQQDALHWSLPDRLQDHPMPRKIVGNLPYNVATALLMNMIRFPQEIAGMVLMLQREVADRLVAKVGTREYGGITLLVHLDWDVRLAFQVPSSAFYPRPKVESAVVSFNPLPKPRVDVGDRRLYRQLVRAAFGQRRKTLKNALRRLKPNDPHWSETLLKQAGIQNRRRGETLSLEEFAHLSRIARQNE